MTITDIHCHLLPCIDDGPPDMDAALNLARALLSAGITQVIATPHYADDFSIAFREQVQGQYALLLSALQQEGLPLSVFLGGEILLTPRVAQLAAQKELPTLGNSAYVLFELPFYQPLPPYTRQTIFTLRTHGYRPILAHPERAGCLQKDDTAWQSLADAGVLFQVNAGSLCGHYGKSAKAMAGRLLEAGAAHFLATDSHQPHTLPPIREVLANQTIPCILTKQNPQCIISNLPAQAVPAMPKSSRLVKFCRNLL
jgi:protein-tyrosine phosphatase